MSQRYSMHSLPSQEQQLQVECSLRPPVPLVEHPPQGRRVLHSAPPCLRSRCSTPKLLASSTVRMPWLRHLIHRYPTFAASVVKYKTIWEAEQHVSCDKQPGGNGKSLRTPDKWLQLHNRGYLNAARDYRTWKKPRACSYQS
jgi:hypothetical protein